MVMDKQKGNEQRPDDRLLLKLSRDIRKWWQLAKLLEVSDAAIELIEVEEKDPERRFYKVLSKWRKDNHATPKGSVKYLHEQCQVASIDPQTIEDVFGFHSKKEREIMEDGRITALEATVEDLKRQLSKKDEEIRRKDSKDKDEDSDGRITVLEKSVQELQRQLKIKEKEIESLTKVGNLPMNRCDEVSSPYWHLLNQNIPESIKGDQLPQDRINQHHEASKPSHIVAAIDFGTTYSGWAFSFKHEYHADPTKVSCSRWCDGQIVSEKAPTTVLIKPDRKTLDSFGYDAETKYADLASEESSEYKRWYFFRRFKMLLRGEMNFDRNMTVEDETKKTLPAQTVFSLVIRYIKDDMLKTGRARLGSGHILEDEITWVLTVPAIWNDAAKQFMREAAVQAGISSENLKIALEPETASIFCRLLPVGMMVEGGGMCNIQLGSKYMVLDAGGGTVDITVHEEMPGGKLKEIHKASGGDWGGIQVDEAFKQFIISLIGNPVFCRFEIECKDDYLNMFREFEIKKRNITPDKDEKITFRFPPTLKYIFEEETGEDLLTAIQQTRFANKVVLSGGKLRVESSLMKNLFSRAIQNIVCHVKEMMKDREVRQISSILMVGGFSESKMLQDAIRSSFPNVKVIIPQDAGLVVLKGAVVFGHGPFSITKRVCKYTYGVDVSLPFDNKIHDPMKRSEYEDGPRCDGIFDKYVEIGQSIDLNETTKEISYYPLEENQRSIIFKIFRSTTQSPMYVTDEGCVEIGEMKIDVRDMSVPRKERKFLVSMKFGGTEFQVQVREKRTGKSAKATVNLLV